MAKKKAAKKAAKKVAKKRSVKRTTGAKPSSKKKAATKRSAGKSYGVAAPLPEVVDVTPKIFKSGNTYSIGAGLRNFPPNSIAGAKLNPNDSKATFSNTNKPTVGPSPATPTFVTFSGSKFTYTGTTTGSAMLSITVTTRSGGSYSKSVPVTYQP